MPQCLIPGCGRLCYEMRSGQTVEVCNYHFLHLCKYSNECYQIAVPHSIHCRDHLGPEDRKRVAAINRELKRLHSTVDYDKSRYRGAIGRSGRHGIVYSS